MRRMHLILGIVPVLCLLDVSNAQAYLDPGTGSMVIQAVLAAIAAVGVSAGIFWRRIKGFFHRGDEAKPDKPGAKHEN